MATRARRGKRIASSVVIHHRQSDSHGQFMACVKVGKPGHEGRRVTMECAWGSNPRKAVAGAFTKLASTLRGRRGRFAGRR